MMPDYRFEVLALDTPDDDPRWAAYVDLFAQGFLDGRRPDDAVAIYRTHRRADQARLGMITAEGPGLQGRQPVAGFAMVPTTINCGSGLVESVIVHTIVVLPSHRRRGLLTTMMREQLGAARDRGAALAVLTASEATIYGRFGFGPALSQQQITVDTRRFKLRPDAPLAPGSIEFVHPEFLREHQQRIARAHQERYRGAVAMHHVHWLRVTGQWDFAEAGPSRNLRAVVHFDEAGTPDGYAIFQHQGLSSSPTTTSVVQLVSPEPAIDRALWQALVDIDLVERLTYDWLPAGDPLPLSLTDPWAIAQSGHSEQIWLRVLDLPRATAGRRFEQDGSIVLRITDELGYLAGTWRISATDGAGSAQSCVDEPELTLGADALAQLWHGERRASELARAGQIVGETSAVARLGRLFWTADAPANQSGF